MSIKEDCVTDKLCMSPCKEKSPVWCMERWTIMKDSRWLHAGRKNTVVGQGQLVQREAQIVEGPL